MKGVLTPSSTQTAASSLNIILICKYLNIFGNVLYESYHNYDYNHDDHDYNHDNYDYYDYNHNDYANQDFQSDM